MPFNLARDLVYGKHRSPAEVRGNEYMLQSMLASASLQTAIANDRFMYRVNPELFNGLLYTQFRCLPSMPRWKWVKKPKASKAKIVEVIDTYCDIVAGSVGMTPAAFKQLYAVVLTEYADDPVFLRQMLLDINADAATFKRFKIPIDDEIRERCKPEKVVQQALF